MTPPSTTPKPAQGFVRGLNLFDSTMVVIGVMIGSGIFIVSADMSRLIGSPGWMLMAWVLTGVLTITAALSYGELASMLPHAGGMYIYLREAFSPLWGFLYGWTFFTVIQTGTIAAVAVAFARFLSIVFPPVAEGRYLIQPIHITEGYAVSLSTAQLVAIGVIALLTWTNSRGLEYGKIVQNLFTTAKTAALAALILVGLLLGWNRSAVSFNFSDMFRLGAFDRSLGVEAGGVFGLVVALCVAQSGSLFSADSWHDVTIVAGEVKDPRRNLPLAMALGCTAVIVLYLLANVAYLVVLPLPAIQHAPSDRVATAMLQQIFPGYGPVLMAVAIMISTFGCVNSLVLAGARATYAMAQDGLFFAQAGRLNAAHVPGWSLAVQGIWAAVLVLPRTYDPLTKQYGNLYSNLLNYVISAALLFYILTIAGVFRLRRTRPDAPRPYRVAGYPFVPALYILGAATVLVMLVAYRPATTWPGLAIVVIGAAVYGAIRKR
ncbi:Amino acid permease-associated region [Candidatus Sulfopaludibacter sp. SbA4]|nr:Amino acid permease-associated region [Candidatus Sulfopaludibacter sp. SbA4]